MSRPNDRPRLSTLATALAAAVVCALPLAGAGAAPPPRDPFEKLNRATFAFNNALDRMLARPAARAYHAALPDVVQNAVSNLVANATYSVVIVNDLLQGKFRDFGSDTVRLLTNTTLGVGGLFDPATHFGFTSHDEDFGVTLGHWGVPTGPYLVVPLIGPSNFRDLPGRVVDSYTEPAHYLLKTTREHYEVYVVELFDRRVRLLPTDNALLNAYDPYVFMRNAYLERRAYLVHDGVVPDDDLDEPVGRVAPAPDLSIPSLASAAAAFAAEPLSAPADAEPAVTILPAVAGDR
jgi:phospholipid-binding lipoprotein MlaA